MRNGEMTWAGLVKGMREATHMSGNELARRLQVDRATIWRWESGKQRPDKPNLVKAFAELFGLDVEDTLAIAGLRPDGTPVLPPTPPTDPQIGRLLEIINDPATTEETRQLIHNMVKTLNQLAESQPRRPKRRAG